MIHACDTRGMNHTRMGFLNNTCVYVHTQYYTRTFLHVHACMSNVASELASYLPFS